MNGTEIIAFLADNFPAVTSAVSAVTGGLFTAIFLRHNTATKEFEKIKAGQFKEVAEDLLKSGEMTHTEYYRANNFLVVAKKADAHYSKMPKRESFDAYDFDWFIRFYEAVGNISNDEMQDLWARILAGEISHPSSYSLRTIDALKNFNKVDAALFEKVCLHSICPDGKWFLPRYEKFLKEVSINYSDIMQLSELGLMYNDGTIVLEVNPQNGTNLLVSNRDLIMLCSVTDENNHRFNINQYPFTQVGRELASIKGQCMNNDEFLAFAKEIKKENPKVPFEVHRIIVWTGDQKQYDTVDLLAEE